MPILEVATHRLGLLDDFRTAIRGRVDVGGRPVDVVNTHFHYTAEDGLIRARQAADLLEWIGDRAALLIAIGDFNATLDDAGLRGFGQPTFASALMPGTAATTFNTGVGHASRLLDLIFVKSGHFDVVAAHITGTEAAEGVWASNHFAVAATARLGA